MKKLLLSLVILFSFTVEAKEPEILVPVVDPNTYLNTADQYAFDACVIGYIVGSLEQSEQFRKKDDPKLDPDELVNPAQRYCNALIKMISEK